MRPLYCEECQKIFVRNRLATPNACPHCAGPPIRFSTIDTSLWNVLVSLARGLAAGARPGFPSDRLGDLPGDCSTDALVQEAVNQAKVAIGKTLLEALGAPLDVKGET